MNGRRRPIAYSLDDPTVIEGSCPCCGVVPMMGFVERDNGRVVLEVAFEHADGCPVELGEWEPAT